MRGDFAFSVNGAREDSNNFLLDGVYNVDPKLNTFGVRPPVDAIREFEMPTSTYDASFGRSAGAQVNVVTQVGNERLPRLALRVPPQRAFDARNFFAPAGEAAPKYIRNQFGGSVGGPVRHDRTFFFADYEGTRSREGITRVTNVPTLAERAGDFSQSVFGLPDEPVHGSAVRRAAASPHVRHPAPSAAPSPRSILLPNRATPFANFVSSPTQRDRNDSFDVRLDHVVQRRARTFAVPLQLRRPRPLRAVRGADLRGRPRLWQRRAPPQAERDGR